MDVARLDRLEPVAVGRRSVRRALDDALQTTGLALNHYRIAPGDGLPGGLHAHMDQEEVFIVLSGRATFETLAGEVAVEAGEAIRFAPGEFQSGRNAAELELELLAIGAPRDTEDIRIPVPCPACDGDDLRLVFGGQRLRFVCPACGAEHIPGDCPACGDADLRVTRGEDDRPIVRCHGCGSEYARPPMQE